MPGNIWRLTGIMYLWVIAKRILGLAVEIVTGRRSGKVAGYLDSYGVSEQDLGVCSGGLKAAVEDARKCRRALAVYLHSPDHVDTERFVKEALMEPSVMAMLKTNFTFWSGTVESQDAYVLSQKIEAAGYPLFAVFYISRDDMVMVLKAEGLISAAQLYRRLSEALDTCTSVAQSHRSDAIMREERARLREQQERELEEAQQADREAAARELAEEAARMEEEQRVEELEARKVMLRSTIPAEPNTDEPGVVTLKITLFSGESIQRRFRKTDSLEHVYNLVASHESYDGTDFYICSFPSRHLLRTATLEEYDLYPRAAVVVRAISSV
eukprot:TRINITY_DN21134_c0_g1_i1.p1 TRINITY_DN21134_c0_g1~~TRINITY_DN21134_c0_g1_i1.p1  ORF type:complete len:326 (+),score=40.40 TRINITY_DN21134_c0_g1_i1:373-1350(+)